MPHTMLLPPTMAVRMTWARTGAFSSADYSKVSTVLTEANLKDIKLKAEVDDRERAYVYSAIANMDACLRSLDIIFKGRELNFKENEKLRTAYLESVRENIKFGNSVKDFAKSLPSMAIGSVTGLMVLNRIISSEVYQWIIGVGFAGLGYGVYFLIQRAMRYRKQILYLREDYDRNLYYDQYMERVTAALTSLYLDLQRIHKNVFKIRFPVDESPEQIINGLLAGVGSTFCPFVHKHMMAKIITPKLWPTCESGAKDATKQCHHWEQPS